jgi:hypothetical protein
MRFRRWLSFFYSFALWAQVAAGALVAIFGGLQKADLVAMQKKAPTLDWLFGFLGSLQANIWWQLPLMAVLAGVLGLLRKHLGSPWLWDAVKFHLDAIRETAFAISDDDAQHHHRVTLFKHVKWSFCCRQWPWSGWLVAVERSGHTTRSGVLKFKAPDNADEAEGVAGLTWARNRVVRVSKLPDLTENSGEDQLETYAKNTGLKVDDVRKWLPKARSLTGIPVEVGGRLWGIIVLDSRRPDAIVQQHENSHRLVGKLLGKLLEKL